MTYLLPYININVRYVLASWLDVRDRNITGFKKERRFKFWTDDETLGFCSSIFSIVHTLDDLPSTNHHPKAPTVTSKVN
jgi:hypothetical protein